MMLQVTTKSRSVFLLIGFALMLGCSSETPATKTAKPAVALSFADGVAKLEQMRDEIQAAFEAGTPHECDGALHTAADIVTVLPELAISEGKFNAEQMKTVTTASGDLFQQFALLHEGFHPKQEHDHGHGHDEHAGHAHDDHAHDDHAHDDHAEHDGHGDHEAHDHHDHEHDNAYAGVAAAIEDALNQLKSL